MNNLTLVTESLINTIEPADYNEKILKSYFSQNYIQCVDGKTLLFDEFCKHIKLLKQHTLRRKLIINTIISQDDTVFTNHTVQVLTSPNKLSTIKVLAMFKVKDNKIISCDELTFLLEGDLKNKDLGSMS
ncbi:MAG: hypothetical protein LBI72_06865 [Flavobacteriaceae bacterium]|jgi:hypothetical protein|nr:hypothetical protein [Flavobacteriaceae bacterium]